MRLTDERVRSMTLARQFPAIRGRDRAGLIELVGRLGPIQSQVPRSPFLSAAARLPGVDYPTIRDAFADYRLLKTTNLRGTVHTSIVDHFGAIDAVRRPQNARDLRRVLKITTGETEAIASVIEEFCADRWQDRDAIVDQVRQWLSVNAKGSLEGLDQAFARNLVWGHSGLIRKPRDDRWEKRTDIYHRTARNLVPAITRPDQAEAAVIMARVHLGSYGPADRRDIAWWLGAPLGVVDRALATLEPELVHHQGPAGEDLLDLAAIPAGRMTDPGLRLLPEYDGLLLGYAPANRGRFLDLDHLDKIWGRANGQFTSAVMLNGRIVARWRTLSSAASTAVEVQPFTRGSGVTQDLLAGPVADAALALDLTITDARVLPPE